MNDTLEFPEIIDPAAATAGTLAPVAAATLDLRKVDLTDVALAQFGEWRKEVASVTANLKTLALDLSTQAKVDEAKSLRWRLIGQPRAAARTTSKELKSKLAKVSKAIGAEEEAIVQAWDEAETHITPLIDARQAEIDAEKERAAAAKAEAARLEAERQQRHEDGIATLAGYVTKAQGLPAERMAAGLAFVEKIRIDAAHWQEYTERAQATLDDTLGKLRAMHAAQVKAEADAAELEALRREKAERDERDRQAREAAEAKAREEARAAEELAAARAESERLEALAIQQREAREHAALEAERIADLTAAAPKVQDAELALAEAPITTGYTEGPDAQQVLKAEAATPDATDRANPANASPVGGPMGAGQPAAAGPAVADEPATLKIGDINTRIAPLRIDAAGLAQLGITPAKTEGAAKLYRESDFGRLLRGIVKHVEGLQAVPA